jgi:hypothetical protein
MYYDITNTRTGEVYEEFYKHRHPHFHIYYDVYLFLLAGIPFELDKVEYCIYRRSLCNKNEMVIMDAKETNTDFYNSHFEVGKQYRFPNGRTYVYHGRLHKETLFHIYIGIGYKGELSDDIEECISRNCDELLLIPENELGDYTFEENRGFVRWADTPKRYIEEDEEDEDEPSEKKGKYAFKSRTEKKNKKSITKTKGKKCKNAIKSKSKKVFKKVKKI